MIRKVYPYQNNDISINMATKPETNEADNDAGEERMDHDASDTTQEKKSKYRYEFHTTEEHYDTPRSKITVSAIWKGLKAHTTSHGIPHVENARGVLKKGFWTLVSLLMVGMLIMNLYLLCTDFTKYNVDVVIQMQHQRELTFPAVTICNMNPVKRSTVNQAISQELYDLIYGDDDSDLEEGQPVPGSAFPERIVPRNSFRKEEKMAQILADIPDKEKQYMGYQAHEFILDCQYAGYDCYWQQFEPFYNPILGNCYIFNSGWDNATLKMSHKTGRRYGLKLVLNIIQDEYLPDIGESAGIRVVVHPQDRMPFPQDEGVLVGPGILTSIGVRQLTVTRQDGRYGNCTQIKDKNGITYQQNITRNVFEEFYQEIKYTSSACYKTCYQRYLINECGCGDPQFPLTGRAFSESGNVTFKACDALNITQDDCKYNITNLFNEEKLGCPECVLPCDEISYQPEISSVQWPSDAHEADMLTKFSDQIDNLLNDPDDPEKYRRNLLKLEVYYEEFNYENIAERPSYEEGQFASDIGGVIGLWLGWSIMTIFEFIEFGVDLAVLGCLRASSKGPCSKKKPNVTKPRSVGHHDNNIDKITPPPPYNSLKKDIYDRPKYYHTTSDPNMRRPSLGPLLDTQPEKPRPTYYKAARAVVNALIATGPGNIDKTLNLKDKDQQNSTIQDTDNRSTKRTSPLQDTLAEENEHNHVVNNELPIIRENTREFTSAPSVYIPGDDFDEETIVLSEEPTTKQLDIPTGQFYHMAQKSMKRDKKDALFKHVAIPGRRGSIDSSLARNKKKSKKVDRKGSTLGHGML